MENSFNTPVQSNAAANSAFGNEVNIKDLIVLCLSKWYLFVLTVSVSLLVAVLMIASTAPSYSSVSNLIIKQDRRSGTSGLESATSGFSNMGSLFSQQTNVYNEIIAFKSPTLMREVVKRLDLRANYTTRHHLYQRTLYGASLPVTVNMIDFPVYQTMSMVISYKDETSVELSNMVTYIDGKEVEFKEPIAVALNERVNTPVGMMEIVPNLAFYQSSDGKGFAPINMSYSSLNAAASAYSGRLSVSLTEKEATAISLGFVDKTPQRAKDVVSAIIDVYNEKWISDRNQIAVSTSEFINERLAVIEKDLGGVDRELSSYKSENRLLDPEVTGSMYVNQANKIQNEIEVMNNRLNMALYILEYMKSTSGDMKLLPANSGIENSSIETLISEYNASVLQRNNLLLNSSATSPVIIRLDASIEAMNTNILASVENYIVTLRRQIDALQKSAEKNMQKIAVSPIQVEQLTDIERQRKVKESLYLYLLQKREENEMSQAFTAYNTRVIMEPQASGVPISPNAKRILLIALLIGLVIPVGYVYLMEATNTRVRTRKDLESMPIPFIGEIPLAYSRPKFSWLRKPVEHDPVVVKPHSRNMINEAFRVVRSNLEFVCNGNSSSVIEITSYNVGAGKSFISGNLAISLAIKGQKVCLVDLDLRKATIDKYIGTRKHNRGVRDFLSGKVENIEELIVKNVQVEGLDVLPVGALPPNPTELLYSPKMDDMMKYLRAHYDYIFLDCPPLDIVADPAIVNKYANKTLFVVRAELMDRYMLPDVAALYEKGKYKDMIMMLNGTVESTSPAYRRYGYGRYGYGRYGYGVSGRSYGGYYGHNTDREVLYGNDTEADAKSGKGVRSFFKRDKKA